MTENPEHVVNKSEAENPMPEQDLELLEKLRQADDRIREQLARVIIGQENVIEELLIAIFSRGHCILEGVPGLAKTLLISTLAKSLHLTFHRIQFTPDLMPSDITGTEVLQVDRASGERVFKFLPGPVFANIVLADEINRTPPKTQAALLEAMQERQTTIGGQHYSLPDPFFVLATQNPIEQEGTYPLPEAQQDRFMFKILVDYPDFAEEYQIAATTTTGAMPECEPVLSEEEIQKLQVLVRRVPAAPHCIVYALNLVRATRTTSPEAPDFIKEWISWGAGPRAVQNLLLGAKTRAALDGRHCVTIADIKAVAHPVLRHRLLTTFSAQSEGVTPDSVVDRLLQHTPDSESANALPPEVARAFRQ